MAPLALTNRRMASLVVVVVVGGGAWWEDEKERLKLAVAHVGDSLLELELCFNRSVVVDEPRLRALGLLSSVAICMVAEQQPRWRWCRFEGCYEEQ